MFQSMELSLKSLIRSSEGIHLTSYLQHRGSIIELKKQIRESIEVAREHLSNVMTDEDMQRFLHPLSQLLTNSRILKSFKGNVGLFRTKGSFRMLSIPVDVEHLCVIATSFHVKPLLRWIQSDREFLALGIEKGSASLYAGSQNSFKHIDTILFPELLQKNISGESYSDLKIKRAQSVKLDETMEWLNEWLLEATKKDKFPLFLAGDADLTKKLMLKLRYSKARKNSIANTFSRERVLDTISEVRSLLRKETRSYLDKSLVEFYWSEDLNLGKKNIFQIAKAAIQGKVRKLIVADGVQIFGKIDKLTGGISIHPTHLDHEDDDLLDDLAQTVLASGGEVIVVPREQIPKGRPILAILKNSPHTKENLFGVSTEEPQIAYA